MDKRLHEIDERMRDLRVLKQELGELRERMAEQGSDEAASPYCHYIETTAGSSRD